MLQQHQQRPKTNLFNHNLTTSLRDCCYANYPNLKNVFLHETNITQAAANWRSTKQNKNKRNLHLYPRLIPTLPSVQIKSPSWKPLFHLC